MLLKFLKETHQPRIVTLKTIKTLTDSINCFLKGIDVIHSFAQYFQHFVGIGLTYYYSFQYYDCDNSF